MVVSCKTVKDFLVFEANETLSKIIPKLKTDKEVIVFDNGKYLGIVTRKNVLKEGINLPEEKLSNLVYKPASIYEDTSDLDIAKYFIESGAHFLPMLDKEDKNKILCLIHRTDFLESIVGPYMRTTKVSDFANKNVRTISPEDNLAKALSSFHELGLSKLIVFDGRLKGVITLSNVLTYFMHATQITKSNLQGALVKDVMKTDVISIDKDVRLEEAIKLFVEKGVSSIVVLDKNILYGIITKTDILEQYVYAKELESKESTVQISAKFPGINRQDIEDKFSQLDKFNDSSKIFVYYKMGKEKFRGLPLISCRVRMLCPKHNYSMHVEGWGVEHATELAVEKLKRQMGQMRF